MPATATIEQATLKPLTIDAPKAAVVYDSQNFEISATFVVSLAPGQEDASIQTAPITVPAGTWTLRWNLIPGSGVTTAIFPLQDGIVPRPPVPPNVSVDSSQRNPDKATQWVLELTNQVVSVNSFNYDILINWSSGSNALLRHLVHDPTIAVTKDPIG